MPDASPPFWIDRRDRARIPVKIAITVRERNWPSQPASLLDISTSGCRVTDIALRAGQLVWVTIDDFKSLEARVSWSKDWQSGIHFDHPLHQAILRHIAHRVPA